MGARHFTLRPPAGNVSRMPDSWYTPRRPFPRHSGQSPAKDGITRRNANKDEAEARNRMVDVNALSNRWHRAWLVCPEWLRGVAVSEWRRRVSAVAHALLRNATYLCVWQGIDS